VSFSRNTVAFFLCALSGCGGGDELSTSRAAIAHGELDEHGGVIAVISASTATICSGIVVAPRVVITARHCVAPIENGPTVDCSVTRFGDTVDPNAVIVGTTTSGSTPNRQHAVRAVLVPSDRGFCGNDIAALILTQSVAEAPVMPLRDQPARKNEEFTAIGFGRDGNEKSGTRRRREGLHVSCVGGDCSTTRVTSGEWWGDGAVCDGDSGGPALDIDGRVLGIASRKRDGCSGSVYVDLASSKQFVARALDEAERLPEEDRAAACSIGHRGSFVAPFAILLTLAAARFRRSLRRRLGSSRMRDPRAPRRSDAPARGPGRGPASPRCARRDRTTRTP